MQGPESANAENLILRNTLPSGIQNRETGRQYTMAELRDHVNSHVVWEDFITLTGRERGAFTARQVEALRLFVLYGFNDTPEIAWGSRSFIMHSLGLTRLTRVQHLSEKIKGKLAAQMTRCDACPK